MKNLLIVMFLIAVTTGPTAAAATPHEVPAVPEQTDQMIPAPQARSISAGLDARRISASPLAQAGDPWTRPGGQQTNLQNSQGFGEWWRGFSKGTRIWMIVGAVLVVGISAAALG